LNKEVSAAPIVQESNAALTIPWMKNENIWGFAWLLFLKATLPFHSHFVRLLIRRNKQP